MNKEFASRELDPRPVDYKRFQYFISPVLGREYPPTLPGAEQMMWDELTYRNEVGFRQV